MSADLPLMLCHNPLLPLAASYLPQDELDQDTLTWTRRTAVGEVQLQVPPGTRLPCGPTARCLLYYLNARARAQQSPSITLDEGFQRFIQKIPGPGVSGMRDQLQRLSQVFITCTVRTSDGQSYAFGNPILEKVEIDAALEGHVRFSPDAWEALMQRGVMLEPAAVAHLAHDALALDLYALLAGVLPELREDDAPALPLSWLYEHFGEGLEAQETLLRRLTQAFSQVRSLYRNAQAQLTEEGLWLHRSPPCCP